MDCLPYSSSTSTLGGSLTSSKAVEIQTDQQPVPIQDGDALHHHFFEEGFVGQLCGLQLLRLIANFPNALFDGHNRLGNQ